MDHWIVYPLRLKIWLHFYSYQQPLGNILLFMAAWRKQGNIMDRKHKMGNDKCLAFGKWYFLFVYILINSMIVRVFYTLLSLSDSVAKKWKWVIVLVIWCSCIQVQALKENLHKKCPVERVSVVPYELHNNMDIQCHQSKTSDNLYHLNYAT